MNKPQVERARWSRSITMEPQTWAVIKAAAKGKNMTVSRYIESMIMGLEVSPAAKRRDKLS